jgi:hypothetical protein
MWKKVAAVGLVGLGMQISLWASPGNAYEYADTPTEVADGIHIPKKVELLEDTPYYVIPNALLNKAEGSFAPQTVKVIEAEVNWATSPNWWKIHTDVGDRWIKTSPWQIEAPPPPSISLMAETPLFAKPSEKSEPTATLSPQDVLVVDAEKGWFTNRDSNSDYNPKKWIKIHTTWLGDQWVHLNLDQIGTYHDLDREVFYGSTTYNLTPHYDYQTYHTDGELKNQFLHQIGQFRAMLGSFYKVETNDGTKWALSSGELVQSNTKTITRSKPSPLYTYPNPYFGTPILVPAGDLQSMKEIHTVQTFGILEDWYYVQTDLGEGWFSPTFADPEDSVMDTATIQLNNVTSIYRYPNTSVSLENGQLGLQTLQPLAAWTAPDGIRWYQINSFVGNGWIKLAPYSDRLTLKNRASDMQITGSTVYQGAIYTNEAGDFTYGTETIGYVKAGEPAFNAAFLAGMYHYDVTGPDIGGWWTYTNAAGYAFQIKNGETLAKTLWKGKINKLIQLAAAPTPDKSDDSPLLSLTNIRTLLGSTTVYYPTVSFGSPYVQLSAHQYEIANLQLPAQANGDHVHISGLLYDSQYNDKEAITQTLQVIVKDRDKEESLNTVHTADLKYLYNLGYTDGLYDVSLDQPLKPGMNHLTIQFKVGERILMQRVWDVTATML